MYFFIEKWKADPVKTVGIVPYMFFVLEAKPRDKKTHCGHDFYSKLQRGTHFECLKRSVRYLP